MRPEERDFAYLWDMLDSALAVREFISGRTRDDFEADRMLRAAVERHVEIIGEAARRVSEEFKTGHPEFAWRSMIGQRNILAHEYGEVRPEMIWNVAALHLPNLISALERILPDSGPVGPP